MIDIVIPYYTGAAIVCLGMLTSILMVVLGAMTGQGDCVVVGLLFLFGFDFGSAIASRDYLTTPTCGSKWCCEDHKGPSWNSGAPTCVYPTANPYELQPIHPILWIVGFFQGALQLVNGAVKVSGGVAP